MLRVMSFNMNGIRAASRKGFFEWFATQNVDILCIQETKARLHDFDEGHFQIEGYTRIHSDAIKKGYSGVAIYSRIAPTAILTSLDYELADSEGRFAQMDFNNLSVISLYLPSGSSGDERQQLKFQFMTFLEEKMRQWRASGRAFIICGDWNIVHKEMDIKNFKANQKNSGCLPEERAWLDALLTERGWVDAFRVVNQEAHQYTWWSHRGRARENNVGWRIDYQIITSDLKDQVVATSIYKDSWFSDHAPLTVDYTLTD